MHKIWDLPKLTYLSYDDFLQAVEASNAPRFTFVVGANAVGKTRSSKDILGQYRNNGKRVERFSKDYAHVDFLNGEHVIVLNSVFLEDLSEVDRKEWETLKIGDSSDEDWQLFEETARDLSTVMTGQGDYERAAFSSDDKSFLRDQTLEQLLANGIEHGFLVEDEKQVKVFLPKRLESSEFLNLSTEEKQHFMVRYLPFKTLRKNMLAFQEGFHDKDVYFVHSDSEKKRWNWKSY